LYAWYFKEVPPGVPTDGCVVSAGHTLLYAGISPKAPPKDGEKPSKQRLKDRILNHFRGNAEGSTLRLSLGVLLGEQLGIELRRVGRRKRMTFGDGEDALSEWMESNTSVGWVVHPRPWELEAVVISELSLPLNLDQNKDHQFHAVLTNARRQAKKVAREKDIVG